MFRLNNFLYIFSKAFILPYLFPWKSSQLRCVVVYCLERDCDDLDMLFLVLKPETLIPIQPLMGFIYQVAQGRQEGLKTRWTDHCTGGSGVSSVRTNQSRDEKYLLERPPHVHLLCDVSQLSCLPSLIAFLGFFKDDLMQISKYLLVSLFGR